jgi:glycosyltransferase involved in cell wall biosynthesis
MKVAILGTRGVPPSYGGFETFAAELGVRLVKRGYDVTVYCRQTRVGDSAPRYLGDEWNGLHRITAPYIPGKYLETVTHTFVSALDAMRRDFDAVILCNAANAFVLPLLRAARIPVAINVDGIERRRRKWNILGRAVYAVGEAFSVSFANAVVADADTIADYYRAEYGAPTHVIAYGADFPDEEDSDVLERLGLQPRGYILYVSRFEPENNPLEVVRAYEDLGDAPPLVMLGKGLYAPDLVAELHAHASDRILFPGALYGRDYRTLQRNARLYVQATEVGGTHPALVEAMGSGGAVLALGTPENREVGGDAVGYFQFRPVQTLSGMLYEWLDNPLRTDEFRARARLRAEALYSWESVADQYDRLIHGML